MNLLLDTHIFIWWDIARKNLTTQRIQMLTDQKNNIFLSLAGVWEMQIKIQIGKFSFPHSLAAIVEEQQKINNLQILPVNLDHIYELDNLPFHHKDPFDRIIIAQAIVENLTVVTDDPAFSAYPVKVI